MGTRRTKEPLPGLEHLTDAELAASVLSNWHQLNAVLKHRQPVAVLERLLKIEKAKQPGPRQNFLVRLTRAINRAVGKARLEEIGQ